MFRDPRKDSSDDTSLHSDSSLLINADVSKSLDDPEIAKGLLESRIADKQRELAPLLQDIPAPRSEEKIIGKLITDLHSSRQSTKTGSEPFKRDQQAKVDMLITALEKDGIKGIPKFIDEINKLIKIWERGDVEEKAASIKRDHYTSGFKSKKSAHTHIKLLDDLIGNARMVQMELIANEIRQVAEASQFPESKAVTRDAAQIKEDVDKRVEEYQAELSQIVASHNKIFLHFWSKPLDIQAESKNLFDGNPYGKALSNVKVMSSLQAEITVLQTQISELKKGPRPGGA